MTQSTAVCRYYIGERTNIVGLFSTKDIFDVIETKINSLPLEAKLGSLAQDFRLKDHQRSIWRVTAGVKASSLLRYVFDSSHADGSRYRRSRNQSVGWCYHTGRPLRASCW
jgi:hypothetical protein